MKNEVKEMVVDYKQHYDDNYWLGRKTFDSPDGKRRVYHGPALTWDGFQFIADAVAPLVPGKSILDIGCSAGDLAKRFLAKGYDAYGVDISEYAIKNTVPEMKGRTALVDITTCPEYVRMYHPVAEEARLPGVVYEFVDGKHYEGLPDAFDVVMATDLLEHIYEEDLDRTFEWMMSRTKRWMFFCVATALPPTAPGFDPNKIEFVHRKGEPVPVEWQATAVSGHVNVRRFSWWARFFTQRRLEIKWKEMYMLQAQREMNPAWRDTMGWNMQTTFILQKV